MRIRRGFIAAPLIGTIIFLACIMWIVNVSNAESNGVSEIVSNAYHNRVVSLLEIYRTDLASIFRMGLEDNIETALTSQCWDEFSVGNDVEPFSSYPQARLERCQSVSQLIRNVVCLQSATDSNGVSHEYGLAQWFAKVAQPFKFEGISYSLANSNVLTQVDTTGANGALVQAFCNKMVGDPLFDCNTFEKSHYDLSSGRNLQCCAESAGGVCTKVLPGCEDGSFYLHINIKSDREVFRQMPRIQADDGEGNVVRSGALADEDFNVHIRYPLFDYYDRAFNFAEYVSYGNDKSVVNAPYSNDVHVPNTLPNINDGSHEGIVEGYCSALSGGDCALVDQGDPQKANLGPYTHNFAIPGVMNYGDLSKKVRESFVTNVLSFACKSASSGSFPLNFKVTTDDGESANSFDCTDSQSSANINSYLEDFARQVPCGSSFCAAVTGKDNQYKFSIVDKRPQYQVLYNKQNKFCFNLRLKHDPSA